MVHDALLAFMRTGDPATDAFIWPHYEPERRATLILDRESGVEDAPREAERRFWEHVRFGEICSVLEEAAGGVGAG